MYQDKAMSADAALAGVKKGSRVFIGSGCGEPQHLVENLVDRAIRLYDVEIIQVLAARDQAYTAERLAQHFRVKNFFVAGRGARGAIWDGRAEYIPMFMSRVPRLFSQGLMELGCALVQVSPPNQHGYMSLGVSVDVAKEAVAAAGFVIAQVNPAMPITLGDSFIHLSEVDAIVEYKEPLLEYDQPAASETDHLVGANIARLVDDGSTVHTGLGRIPTAALMALKDKKDIGVHTDMLTDAHLDLIRKGVITNRKKQVHPNRLIASYCLGTRKLFDFVHLNPFVEFYPISQTNDPFFIGNHDNMVSIHEVMQVDLTGQACTSLTPTRIQSGIGGMVDFMRGALRSANGKFILALPSTNESVTESNIVPAMAEGSGAVASRAAVQYVVTEFGSVNLQAKSIRDRAVALIEIAHPRFREELYNHARTQGLLSSGDPISLFRPVIYPQQLAQTIEVDGESLLLRPARASDVPAIQDFFYRLNDRDVHFRFLRSMKAFPRQEMAAMANIDYHNRMTVLALKGEIGFERVEGIARYRAVEHGMVEVDIAVAEAYRRKGIGRRLMKSVFDIARNKDFRGVVAYVAHDNPTTLKLIKQMGYDFKALLNMGVFEAEVLFANESENPKMEIVYPDRP